MPSRSLSYAKIVQGERRVSQACLGRYAEPQPILCKDSANQEQNNKVPSECFAKMPPEKYFLSVEHFLKTIHIFAFRSPHCAHIASYPSHLIIWRAKILNNTHRQPGGHIRGSLFINLLYAMQLTQQQQQAFDAIKTFIDSNASIFILRGYAGTIFPTEPE